MMSTKTINTTSSAHRYQTTV